MKESLISLGWRATNGLLDAQRFALAANVGSPDIPGRLLSIVDVQRREMLYSIPYQVAALGGVRCHFESILCQHRRSAQS
jgi:hypothetical protein